jgi:ABC-2 type transport system ATP-binding protein
MKELYEISSAEFGKRLAYFTKLLSVEGISKTPVRNLSLGERMKCNIIAALLHKPKLVFLDEPTVGVDLIAKDRIREFIEKVNREEKTTFVITTHDMGDIEKLCKRIIIINHGEIVYDGLLSKIKEKYIKDKHLNIVSVDPIKPFKFKGCKVMPVSDYELKIEVNLKEQTVENVMEFLLKKFKIADITVSNPEIEEIIKQIYRK